MNITKINQNLLLRSVLEVKLVQIVGDLKSRLSREDVHAASCHGD